MGLTSGDPSRGALKEEESTEQWNICASIKAEECGQGWWRAYSSRVAMQAGNQAVYKCVIDVCRSFWSEIQHRGCAQCTAIFILRKHNCGLLSTGIFRQQTMNRYSCQHYGLRSEMLEAMGYGRQELWAISSEKVLIVNIIKHFRSGEPWIPIIHHCWEILIIEQELLNLDPKLILWAQIQLLGTHNISMCPICKPSSNCTYVQF